MFGLEGVLVNSGATCWDSFGLVGGTRRHDARGHHARSPPPSMPSKLFVGRLPADAPKVKWWKPIKLAKDSTTEAPL